MELCWIGVVGYDFIVPSLAGLALYFIVLSFFLTYKLHWKKLKSGVKTFQCYPGKKRTAL